jgi:hypothetical protein
LLHTHTQIVGLDSTPSAKDNVVIEMTRQHFVKIRENPAYQKAAIFVYTEANMMWHLANRIEKTFDRDEFQPIFFESRDSKKKGRAGVWTSPHTKILMYETMKNALTSNSLFYAKDFISKDTQKQKDAFEREVHNFQLEHDEPSMPWGITKIHPTGKSRGKDDLCIVIQLALYWSELRRAEPSFVEYLRSKGWTN